MRESLETKSEDNCNEKRWRSTNVAWQYEEIVVRQASILPRVNQLLNIQAIT